MKISNKFCVYTHDIGGVVFYVGKGRSYRPFEFTRRNKFWNDFVSLNGNEVNVEILKWFVSEDDALLFEADTIRKIKPKCNLLMNGFTQTDSQKLAASKANKGKVVSNGTKGKISKSMKGKVPHNKGIKTCDELKEKLRAFSNSRPIVDQNGVYYHSAKQASAQLLIPWSTLRSHLSGKLKHARGIVFKYA